MKKHVVAISIFMLSVTLALAQNSKKRVDFKKHTLSQTFDSIYQYSNNYQEFKVVKRNWLQLFKNKMTDSLKAKQKAVLQLHETIDKQEKKINTLSAKIEELNHSVASVNTEKENISFLGTDLKKDKFKSIFWGITALLLCLLALFIYKFKNSNAVTKQAKDDLLTLEEEFEAHRKTALEREQRVMRKLQDEINKNKS